MNILGIESSCDDTSVALINVAEKKIAVLREQTASQLEIHQQFGGVVPELAGRKHAEAIVPLIEHVLAGETPDAIAVTAGPGLMTGLLVGVEAAKVYSYLTGVPIIRTNHILGHISSVLLNEETPANLFGAGPHIALIVSGGHTELLLVQSPTEISLLGKTRDDAAGEAFDKIAKLLDLPYPGGPAISKHATQGDAAAIPFPRPMITDESLDMSFAGLKTAVRYHVRDNSVTDQTLPNICASAQQAIVDVLVKKTQRAVQDHQPASLILAGGVSANELLRSTLKESLDIPVHLPPKKYCMDNGTMIAVAGSLLVDTVGYTEWKQLEADPNWRVWQ